ncbi:LLM class flavin-dependent oxidoreductase [Streptomyces turgidiscabies]|uniref:LLM class flavin-dependent oxidoreductase n=1 Tax=Streptomyces turgidiscabies TaxID=85558 RepID=UPI0027D87CD8|nr:LLM class flavin-dependent oxidoreductase [Streptomyces turgidiscabies]
MDLSLFYFADDSTRQVAHRYELLLQGARFADNHGFAAVWTPERHFHRFGGNYPNPAVTGAAVAAVTERVAVRAGSVVAPLHNPEQIARDSWLINASSNGRAGVSLASGWNRGDFVLNPAGFNDRIRSTMEAVHALRDMREDRDPGIPVWLSSGGSPETFAAAGRLGVGVLTHLASQTPAVLAQRIQEYRRAFRDSGSQGSGHVALMLHAYVGQRKSEVDQEVRGPLEGYLMSAMNLMRPVDDSRSDAQSRLKLARLAVQPAYEKYMHGCSLIGTVDHALSVAEESVG